MVITISLTDTYYRVSFMHYEDFIVHKTVFRRLGWDC